MIAVPLTALWVMPAGLIALLLMPLHLEALALVPMGWGAQAVVWVARATSALPDATIIVPHIPAWGLCVFSAGLAWLGLWKTRRRLLGVVVMLVGLASPVLDHPPDLLVSDDGRLIAVRTGARGVPATDAGRLEICPRRLGPILGGWARFKRCQKTRAAGGIRGTDRRWATQLGPHAEKRPPATHRSDTLPEGRLPAAALH